MKVMCLEAFLFTRPTVLKCQSLLRIKWDFHSYLHFLELDNCDNKNIKHMCHIIVYTLHPFVEGSFIHVC